MDTNPITELPYSFTLFVFRAKADFILAGPYVSSFVAGHTFAIALVDAVGEPFGGEFASDLWTF